MHGTLAKIQTAWSANRFSRRPWQSPKYSEIAKPDEKGDFIVAFPDAVQERCSANFRQRMNGQTLLYSVLALPVGNDSAENIYFVSALMRASQQLCHSENPVQMGR